MKYLKAFLAGFLATIIFHQGLLFILNATGLIAVAPYSMKPTYPFGVPSIVSLSFFGGLWGILLLTLTENDQGAAKWIKSFIFGAIAPTLVAVFVVSPLKGIEISTTRILMGIFLNGVWGIGTCWLMSMMKLSRRIPIHHY